MACCGGKQLTIKTAKATIVKVEKEQPTKGLTLKNITIKKKS